MTSIKKKMLFNPFKVIGIFIFKFDIVSQNGPFIVQSKLFITSLVITDYSLSDIRLLGTDLFQLKFPLYNRIFI